MSIEQAIQDFSRNIAYKGRLTDSEREYLEQFHDINTLIMKMAGSWYTYKRHETSFDITADSFVIIDND